MPAYKNQLSKKQYLNSGPSLTPLRRFILSFSIGRKKPNERGVSRYFLQIFLFFLPLSACALRVYERSGFRMGHASKPRGVLVVLIVNKRGAPSAAVGRRSQTKIERTLHTSGENFHSRIQSISRAEQIFWNPTRRLITTPEIEISAVRSWNDAFQSLLLKETIQG